MAEKKSKGRSKRDSVKGSKKKFKDYNPDVVESLVELNTFVSYSKKHLRIYGSYVVEDRAIPDFRDGLKPVQRKLIYSMFELGMTSTTKPKKSARVVGDVLGKYHPHGDSAAYGALVGLANTTPEIVTGQGNWGGPTDPAAAMRYCFVGGTRIMTEEGLVRIDDIPQLVGENKEDYLYSDKYKVELDMRVASLSDPLPASHWINSGYQKTLGLRTYLGNSVRCTPNQPFYVLEGLDFTWKNAEDLIPGDRVCLKLESNLDPSSGKDLPAFNYIPVNTQANVYDPSCFPSVMSEDLAFVLGSLVAEGNCRGRGHGIGFSNTDVSYYTAFKKAFKNCFGDEIEITETLHEPRSYGKKKFKALYIKYDIMGRWSENVGISWGSYNQVVPECIFRSSKKEVSAFLSGLFEGDGCVSSAPTLNSESKRLLKDVQLLLQNYFGVYSNICKGSRLVINGAANKIKFYEAVPFISKRKIKLVKKFKAQAVYSLTDNLNCGGGFQNDSIPKEFVEALQEAFKKFKLDAKTYKSESGEILSVQGNQNLPSPYRGVANLFARIPTVRKKLNHHLDKYADIARLYWPTLVSKLEEVVRSSFMYDEVVEIKSLGRRWVYDLTVPNTHAFVANGFVSHNTECKLSKFTDTFLLDPGYMKIREEEPNYDDTLKQPMILPSLLPLLLIMGNTGGVAYGVRGCNPAFTLKSVTSIVAALLKRCSVDKKGNVEVNASQSRILKLCQKRLEIQAPYGSSCVSTEEELNEFIKTGRANLKYTPNIIADFQRKKIEIKSYAPGFASESAVEKAANKISMLPDVARWGSDCGKKRPHAGPYGCYYYVVPKRGITEDAFFDLADKVRKILTGSEYYNLGITIRSMDNVDFAYCKYAVFFHQWLRYRIQLELRYLAYLIAECNSKLEKLDLLLFAVQNCDKILDAAKPALKSKDPAAFMAKRLKVTREKADAILKLQLYKLAKLEESALRSQIKEVKSEIGTLASDMKDPAPRIRSHLLKTVKSFI